MYRSERDRIAGAGSLFAAFVVAWFVYFTGDGLGVHFTADDQGNGAHYFRGGPLALAVSQFTLWRGDYRPMGGLFYVPILSVAGLDPVPYQAAHVSSARYAANWIGG